MSQSILIFDFGSNEDAAQQGRHKIDAWKQGFRLGNKMLLKFDRDESPDEQPSKHSGGSAGESAAAKKPGKAVENDEAAKKDPRVRLFVRLDFSDHEKLSHQRWLDRIPSEEPFKSAKGQTVRTGDPEFLKTAEHFESMD